MTEPRGRAWALVRALASPAEDGSASLAAREVLEAPDPNALVEAAYPDLVAHRVLTNAIAHLEREGGDVDRLSVTARTFRSIWPLAMLLPASAPLRADRVSLGAIRRELFGNRTALDEEVAWLRRAVPDGRFMAVTGHAFHAGYRAYAVRMEYDTDLFVWEIDEAIRLLDALRTRGSRMHNVRMSLARDGWHAEFHTGRRTVDERELHVDVAVGAKVGRWGPIGPLPRVERARPIDRPGGALLIPGPEDMLLWSAVQQAYRSAWSLRDLNDARIVLQEDRGAIDWDHLCEAALRFDVAHVIERLVGEAERATGEALAPAGVRRRLASGAERVRATGGGRPEGGVHTSSALTAEGPAVIPRYILTGGRRAGVRATLVRIGRLGRRHPGVVAAVARARAERWMLATRIRLGRSEVRGAAVLLALLRRLGRRSGSLCELRATAKPPGPDFCLSRTAARGRRLPGDVELSAGEVLAAVVAGLPDHTEEEAVRIRPVDQGEGTALHRCRMFVYSVFPVDRRRTHAAGSGHRLAEGDPRHVEDRLSRR